MRSAGSRGRAVVVGAGIAGLASGRALRTLGYDVRLLERDGRLRSEGAGLTLWPNALRALRALGLEEAASSARALDDAVTLTPDGRLLSRLPMDMLRRRFGPLVSVYRPELLTALRDGYGGPIEVGAGGSAAGGRPHLDGEPVEAAVIVGAAGVNSLVPRPPVPRGRRPARPPR